MGAPVAGEGQLAATVPASSDVYRRLEALTAIAPVHVHLGQRPASVTALLGVLRRLEAALEALPAADTRREPALEETTRLRVSLATAGGWRFGAAASLYGGNAVPARIDSNGLGTLSAVEHPFAADRRGIPAPAGAMGELRAVAGILRPRFAIVAEPMVSGLTSRGRGDAGARIARGYVRGVMRNVALQVGIEEHLWGQSVQGPLFLSENASGFPAIVVSTDTAIVLPWLFRLAGPVRGTLLVADLGRAQSPPHARLAGWQVGIHPWSTFELGVSVLVHTGGNGGPPATFLERVVDLFPIIDALAPQHADLQISNKIAGGNLRARFPALAGLDVYYELAIDDFDGRRLVSSFVDDAGHLFGGRIAPGPVAWRAELHRTSLRLYEHAQFRSGLTYRDRLLGSPLGPNAKGAYLGAEWLSHAGLMADAYVASESRDPSQYSVTVSGERDRGFTFVRLTNDPAFRRLRGSVGVTGPWGSGSVRARIGYHRAWREGSAPRHEWGASFGFDTRALRIY